MEIVRKSHVQRFMVVILIVALCLAWFIQPVKAIAIADDVALALLVGALAAVGITAAAPNMTVLSEKLDSLIGEWEISRGLTGGTLIGLIGSTAVVLGQGAYQLGNSAWEKIKDFVGFLQDEKGLAYEYPYVEVGQTTVTDNNGNTYSVYDVSTLSETYIDSAYWVAEYVSMGITSTWSDFVGKNMTFGNWTLTVQGSGAFSWSGQRSALGQALRYESNAPAYLAVLQGHVFLVGSGNQNGNHDWEQALQRPPVWYTSGTKTSQSPFSTNFLQRCPTLEELNAVSGEGWSITQDYPEDAEPLPYVPDLPLNVRIPGEAASDLEGIAAGIVESVDAGDLEAVGAEGADIGELQDYSVSLTSFFPFCIPFDVYHMISTFVAEPEAPYIEVPFTFSPEGAETDDMIVIDLEPFDDVARVLRSLELVLFCVGLAFITRKVIRW